MCDTCKKMGITHEMKERILTIAKADEIIKAIRILGMAPDKTTKAALRLLPAMMEMTEKLDVSKLGDNDLKDVDTKMKAELDALLGPISPDGSLDTLSKAEFDAMFKGDEATH